MSHLELGYLGSKLNLLILELLARFAGLFVSSAQRLQRCACAGNLRVQSGQFLLVIQEIRVALKSSDDRFHLRLPRTGEDAVQRVVILRGNRVELVVVT